jgi:peptide/nickel transport system substrate-binding protein
MPISMSRKTRVAIGTVGALLLLVGCSSGGGSGGAGGTGAVAVDAGKPVQGGTLTFAVDTEPTSWDIHVSPQDITAEIQREVFDSLVSEDSSGKFHPWLATSWTVAPNLESYTFHLRHDVKFSDGTPFDAAAVKANFDHIVAPSTKSQYASTLIGPYTGTQVIDPYTVKITFSKPFAPFLQAASTTYLGFYSPKVLAADASSLGGGGPVDVGTGPFVFSGYTKGQQAVFTRNPDYDWGPATAAHTGPAYLDKLVVRFLPDSSVRLGALTSGQVQVAKSIPNQSVSTVQDDSALKLLTKDAPGGNYNLWLNASLAPLNDQRVREAVQRGINIGQDVKTVEFGQFPRAWSPISPSTPDYDTSLDNSWPYDPALANQLLDQAGWTGRDSAGYRTKDGKRLVLDWPQAAGNTTREGRDVLGEAIQADLQKIGIQVLRPTLDIGTYVTEAYGGKVNVLDSSWARFEPDVLWLFFNSASTPATGGQNATFYSDPQIDQWTNQARTTLNPAIRQQDYDQTQQRVISLATTVPIYTPVTIDGESTQVRGLTFDADSWLTFYDTWLAGK